MIHHNLRKDMNHFKTKGNRSAVKKTLGPIPSFQARIHQGAHSTRSGPTAEA